MEMEDKILDMVSEVVKDIDEERRKYMSPLDGMTPEEMEEFKRIHCGDGMSKDRHGGKSHNEWLRHMANAKKKRRKRNKRRI